MAASQAATPGRWETKAASSIVRWHQRDRRALERYMIASMDDERAAERIVSEIEPTRRQYLAGFFDGDGCIKLKVTNKGTPHVAITISQSHSGGEPPELQDFKQVFGGGIHSSRARKETHRTAWELEIGSRTGALALLEIVATCGVLKAPQAIIALSALKAVTVFHEAWRHVARLKDTYANLDIDEKKLAVAYLGGLFASEGSVAFAVKRTHITITQSGCRRLLEAIKSIHGGGIHKKNWHVGGEHGREFLRAIRPFLVGQKVDQADLALRCFEECQSMPKNSGKRGAHRAVVEKEMKKTQEKINIPGRSGPAPWASRSEGPQSAPGATRTKRRSSWSADS